MLSPNEYYVGTLGAAKPLSLVLPRNKHEATILIGKTESGPAAVFLSGQFSFQFFSSSGNENWGGIIVPDVCIEVDETSLFDPAYDQALGSLVRLDTRLIIPALAERSFGRSTPVTLCENLPASGDLRAAFAKWRVVIGGGFDKRVLLSMDARGGAIDSGATTVSPL
jgi:hypothetical protein